MAWDDTKSPGDLIKSDEWNAMTADQKNRLLKTGGDVGDGTNYISIASNGTITLHGSARVKHNLRVIPEMFKLPATDYPARGTHGVFSTLDYADNKIESSYCDIILPFQREIGTDMEIELFWLSETETTGDVVWGIEYKAITDGDTINSTTTTIEEAFTTNSIAGALTKSVFTTKMLAANIDNKNILGFRLYRNGPADSLSGDALMVGANFVFITNKLGKAL